LACVLILFYLKTKVWELGAWRVVCGQFENVREVVYYFF